MYERRGATYVGLHGDPNANAKGKFLAGADEGQKSAVVSIPAHELVEAAAALLLIKKRELVLVKDPEEFVPFDRLEAFVGLRKIDAQDAAGTLLRFSLAGGGGS